MPIVTRVPGIYYYPDLPSGYGPLLAFPPRFVAIHKTKSRGVSVATARQEAHYAHTRPKSGATSAHFYTDSREIVGHVPLNYRAWAARSHGNQYGWHVEVCGNTGSFSTAEGSADKRAAYITAKLCRLGNIPIKRLTPGAARSGQRGIIGHDGITLAWPEDNGTHTDPDWGSNEWDTFLRWVAEYAKIPQSTGEGEPLVSKLPVLRRGDKGQHVRNAQNLLEAHGISVGPSGADGDFGGNTESAVKTFQTRRKIGVDGVIGRGETWPHLLDVQ